MIVRNLFVPALAAGLLLGGVSVSQAQFFNFTTVYSAAGYVAPTQTLGTTSSVVVTNGSNLTGLNSNGVGGGGTDIIVTNFGVTSSTNTGDTFNLAPSIALTLTATDQFGVVQGNSQTRTLTSTLTGNITNNSVTSAYTPTNGPQTFTLSNGIFRVDYVSFGGIPAPGSGTLGSLRYHVTQVAVPEPGSIAMLIGMGVSGSAFVLRRRRAVK